MRRIFAIATSIILLFSMGSHNAEISVYADTNNCSHAWVWVVDVPPLCTVSGLRHEECKKCGLTRNLKSKIEPLGKHYYENECDTTCNVCEAKRKVKGHSYKSECDAYCEKCGAKRYVGEHKYATNCDKECLYCGEVRHNVDHKYKNSCDTTCNSCGEVRKITHKYNNVITKATTSYNGKLVSKCKVCNKVEYSKILYRAKTVKLEKTKYSYTSKAIKPKVIVKNSKGNKISSKYYTVKYSKGRKAIGTYKATVTFRGRYKGKMVLTFKITPKPTTITTLKANKNGFTVKYKKQTTSGGYQIQYSTSKKFSSAKTAKTSGNKNISKTVKKLNSKKTYYVRVRTYKKKNGKTYYSNWSKAKTIKTK